jgi:hypothetical protein
MSDDRTFERNARAWLELGPTDAPDPVVESALLAIEQITQERDLRTRWRLPTMNPFARLATVAVIAAIAVGGAVYVLRGQSLSAGSPTPPPLGIEGTWDVDFTRVDMLAAGIVDAAEDDPSNYGHFRLALASGRWQLLQITGTRASDSGTYVLAGLTISLTNAKGEGPFVMPYTVSDTTLTLGRGGPVTFRVKPWTRVSPTTIEGTWETTFTRDEMLAAGIADSGEDDPSNYGHFTLSIHAGTAYTVQLSAPQTGTGVASYTVSGNTYSVSTTGQERFSWTFTVTETTLTFSGGGPVTLRVKPWTRIGP